MKTKFLVNGRWYKTPCKTVLNADNFTVNFFTGVHTIIANVSDKCYFDSIDNITLSDIKRDFYFSRNYTKPQEFLSKLYETLISFLNTSVTFSEGHFPHSSDDVIRRILVLQEMKKEQFEIVSKPTETEATNPVEINNKKLEINSMYGITANSPDIYNEYNETKELLAEEEFERLTRTLYKSLFKAIGLSETRKIPFIISNNMVFFNYNGTQYKYYPSQCKIFKKCGRKYQRINWKYFANDNSPNDQKQAIGRSPPFTPDIRSTKND